MNSARKTASITVKVRKQGRYHIFTSEDIYGLYVASRSLRKAYDQVAASIQALAKENYGVDCEVSPASSFSEFVQDQTELPRRNRRAVPSETQKQFLVRAAA